MIELIEIRSDFLSIPFEVNHKLLQAFQVDDKNILTFCHTGIFCVRGNTILIEIIQYGFDITRISVCLRCTIAGSFDPVNNSIGIETQIFHNVVIVKRARQQSGTIAISHSQIRPKH